MTKNISTLLQNQHFSSKKIEMTPQVVSNPEKYFSSKREYERLAFNIVIDFSLRGKRMYFSQTWLGKQAGVSRKTINEMVGRWHEDGIVEKEYRHRTTCLYRMSDLFKIPYMQSRLRHTFKAFKVSAFLLVAACSHGPVTALNIKNKYVDGISNIYIEKSTKGMSYQVANLPITQKEKISLSAFPDEVLDFALWKLLPIQKLIDNKVAYLFKVCFNRCKELGIKPDWGWVNKLRDVYTHGIKPRQSFMEKNTQRSKVETENPPVAVTPPRMPTGLTARSAGHLQEIVKLYQSIGRPFEDMVSRQMEIVNRMEEADRKKWESGTFF